MVFIDQSTYQPTHLLGVEGTAAVWGNLHGHRENMHTACPTQQDCIWVSSTVRHYFVTLAQNYHLLPQYILVPSWCFCFSYWAVLRQINAYHYCHVHTPIALKIHESPKNALIIPFASEATSFVNITCSQGKIAAEDITFSLITRPLHLAFCLVTFFQVSWYIYLL